jgi:hypothetical protein
MFQSLGKEPSFYIEQVTITCLFQEQSQSTFWEQNLGQLDYNQSHIVYPSQPN